MIFTSFTYFFIPNIHVPMDNKIREALNILGLGIDANPESIKKARNELLKQWHPDHFDQNSAIKKDAEEQTKKINLAFETLKGYNSASHESSEERRAHSSTESRATENTAAQKDNNWGYDAYEAELRAEIEEEKLRQAEEYAFEQARKRRERREVEAKQKSKANIHKDIVSENIQEKESEETVLKIISKAFKLWVSNNAQNIIHVLVRLCGALLLLWVIGSGLKYGLSFILNAWHSLPKTKTKNTHISNSRQKKDLLDAERRTISVADSGSSLNNRYITKASIWMDKDLDVISYRNGDPILNAETNQDWKYACSHGIGAWCYYNNLSSNGILYNRFAVNDYRGIAPVGWHVATETDWKMVIRKKRIELFSTSPGGLRKSNAEFSRRGRVAYYWVSEDDQKNKSIAFELLNGDFAFEGKFIKNTGEGYSVRCVKDN